MARVVFQIQYECVVEEEVGLGIGGLWRYLDGAWADVNIARKRFGGKASRCVSVSQDMGEGDEGFDFSGKDKPTPLAEG